MNNESRAVIKYPQTQIEEGRVASQEELIKALSSFCNPIYLTEDFPIDSECIKIPYYVTIIGDKHTIYRGHPYTGALFLVEDKGQLNLENVILDGRKHVNQPGDSLIRVHGGVLQLEEETVLMNNHASFNGGGVLLDSVKGNENRLILKGNASIKDCEANKKGGGIYVLSKYMNDKVCMLEHSSLIGNRAKKGGGIHIEPVSDSKANVNFILNGGVIASNQAMESGGGIYRGGDGKVKISLQSGNIGEVMEHEGNNAIKGCGGGIYFQSSSKYDSIKIQEGIHLTGNYAGKHGGGVYFQDMMGATMLMKGALISFNTAVEHGGGIYVSSVQGHGKLKLLKGKVDNNDSYNGGGIYIDSTTVNIDKDTEIVENTALMNGGGIYNDAGSLVINHGIILQNQSENGGGIYNTGKDKNKADCYLKGIALIEKNFTRKAGGGIYNANATSYITMSGSSCVSNNKSETEGGGIYNHRGGVLSIIGNARIGGENENNQAKVNGNGIYSLSSIYLKGNCVNKNGLYISNQEAVPVITGPLKGVVIQIDPSPYVIPSPSKTPIIIAKKSASYEALTKEDVKAFQKPDVNFKHWELKLTDDRQQIQLCPNPYQEQPKQSPHDISIVEYMPKSMNPYTQEKLVPLKQNHKVTFNPHDSYLIPARRIPRTITVKEGEDFQLPNILPRRNGFSFCGWRRRGNHQNKLYRPGQKMERIQEDMVFCACWKIRLFN